MLDSRQHLKDGIAANRTQFAKAGLVKVLNDSYTAERTITSERRTFLSKETVQESFVNTTLRLRADGSFYMAGFYDNAKDGAANYFALGNYEIREAGPAGLKLRLFGLYYESQEYGDCNGCGRDCNKAATAEGEVEQKIFQENFQLKSSKDGKVEIVNQSGGKKIKFDRLILSREIRGPHP